MSTVAHSSPFGGSHRRTSTPQAQRFRREEESLRGLSGNYLDTHRCIEGKKWSAPSRSWAWPPVRKKPTGFPSASTRVWILVLSPPRDRPIASSSPSFFGTGAMLMGAHDRTIDHRVFVVGIRGKILKHPLPDTRLRPSAEAPMHLDPVAKPLRQIAPRHPSPVAVQHRLDEPPIILSRHTDSALTSRQQVSDTIPLVVAKGVAAHWSAPNRLTPYESMFPPRRKPLNDYRP